MRKDKSMKKTHSDNNAFSFDKLKMYALDNSEDDPLEHSEIQKFLTENPESLEAGIVKGLKLYQKNYPNNYEEKIENMLRTLKDDFNQILDQNLGTNTQ